MNWVDPRERTMDQLWEAAQKATEHRHKFVSFTGLIPDITGRGGWFALVWPGSYAGLPERSKMPFGHVAGWGRTPRMALGSLIEYFEEPFEPAREPLWFEHD